MIGGEVKPLFCSLVIHCHTKIIDIDDDKFYTIETSFVPNIVNNQATKITVTTSIITDTETKQINTFEFNNLGDEFKGYCWDIYYPAN